MYVAKFMGFMTSTRINTYNIMRPASTPYEFDGMSFRLSRNIL
jgi:hypothetical protein